MKVQPYQFEYREVNDHVKGARVFLSTRNCGKPFQVETCSTIDPPNLMIPLNRSIDMNLFIETARVLYNHETSSN